MAVDIATIQSYWKTLQIDKERSDHSITNLMQTLIDRLAEISEAYETEKMDREREVTFSRQIQRENQGMKNQVSEIRKRVNRDVSVLVLIDGDGLLFEDQYVREGERGGIQAAQELYTRVASYIDKIMPEVSSDYKIVVRVYANMLGLGKVYKEAGIVYDNAIVTDFARGFTKAKAHFDFVDCGAGKERADNKIGACFNLYVNNIQCKHVLLGCSHDNGYARLLEETHNEDYQKITLLEGVPFESEIAMLTPKFLSTKFDGLFRSMKIDIHGKNYDLKRSQNTSGQHMSPLAVHAQLKPAAPANNGSPNLYQSPYEIPRPDSTSTSDSAYTQPGQTPIGSTVKSPPPGVTSWAGKAQTAASLPQTAVVKTAAMASEPVIKRNRNGQRIDPPKPKDFDSTVLRKVQGMKLCNNFYLKGFCRNSNSECDHDHYYKPSTQELAILRYIARRIVCVKGTSCDDPKCTAGHRCAFIENGVCTFHEQGTCKFLRDMHHNDLTEVRTTVVR